AENGRLGVWEITEDPADLARSFRGSTNDLAEAEGITHPQKRLEFLASRVLMQKIAAAEGLRYEGVLKDDFGKPSLVNHPGWHLSLTHSQRHAAAVLHPNQPVGIDLEAPAEALRRVAPRILSPTELAHADGNLHRLAVYWTAKEALYKLYGKRGLFFSSQLFIEPFGDEAPDVVGWILMEDSPTRCLIHIRNMAADVLAIASSF
ncbi:MAG: 4'-phosphopantetheinyl transferase superfamily protein, partial [Sphingobacteriaceae bacterium]|nr:4'-phosphopantetheinyl transferase superfamily protein [Cytophagaceae bacterium]